MGLLIACTAVANGLTVVTNNTKHLGKVCNIILENWVDGNPPKSIRKLAI